ncbi:MAG: inner membrane-spanning protein YciB [Immundisolibacter sp.]|uniref:inner membrane-spanning protein YciB n=1 Tax=Immundisolibacter sp. TaxID=1934948 RepID=UPI003D0A1798
MKLLFDFLPIIVFFAAYKWAGIYWATGAAVAVSAAQIAALRVLRRPVDRTQWFNLALLAGLGGLTIALRDERFIMWKPSLINWAFGIAFALSLFSQRPLTERMLGAQLALPRAVWRRLTGGWVLFFVLSGALNAYVAFVYQVTPQSLDAQQQAIYAQVATDDGAYAQAVEGRALTELDAAARAALAAQTPAQRQAAYLHKLHQDLWVNFKLFGLLGLTLAFVLAQGVYIGRYLQPAGATESAA